MSGFHLLFVFLAWLVLLAGIVVLVTMVLPKRWWRALIRVCLFIVLLPLPLADEILAKRQFEQLCEQKKEVVVDSPNPQGRTVWFGNSERTETRLGAIRVVQAKRNYVDAKTQEPIYHYYRLDAAGGWFVRSIGISEGGVPLLFHATCQPGDLETIDKKLGLTRINRPISK